MNEFKAYCFTEKDGGYMPPVTLKSAQDIWNYIQLNKKSFAEIRIVDSSDFIVVHSEDGKITFPPQWVEAEKKNV